MSLAHDCVIIIPVHNRREVTLAALRRLAADGVMAWAQVLVVDDRSTDGTANAIAVEFATVALLRGDGTWWWGGAIRRGMEWAIARDARWIFWLNDDCDPPPGALRRLRDFAGEGRVAWIDAQSPGGWRYGGHRRTAWGLRRSEPAEEAAGRVDTFSGNCVCLPRRWIDRVGLPHDQYFPHGLADLDYGLRLHAAGAELRALPGAVAASAEPGAAAVESWLTSPRSMREIGREFRSPKSFLYFAAWRRLALRHWGPIWGWAVFAAPYARWTVIALLRGLAPGTTRAWGQRRRLRTLRESSPR